MSDKTSSDILFYCGDAKETKALASETRPKKPNWRRAKLGAIARQQSAADTWVYFITDGHAIKIGRGHPDERRDGLQTGNPRHLKILGRAKANSADETILHAYFARLRLNGEWFTPDQSIFDLIAKLNAAERDISSGRLTVPDVLHNREGIAMSRLHAAELRALETWLRRRSFAEPEVRSRAACLLSNLHLLESAPESKAARRFIADDIAFIQSRAAA